MKLYGSLASPFVQRAAMAARAKGHDIAVAPPPGGAMQSAEFQALSPMGRVPLLALEDGHHICESGAIVAYLEEVLPGPSLLPGTPYVRARVREIEALAGLELATGLRPILVHRVFGMPGSDEVVAAAAAQARKGALALDRLVAAGPYAVDDRLTLADCVLLPLLTLASSIRHVPEVATLIADHPALMAYHEQILADPVARRTAEEMKEAFRALVTRNQPA